jgi:hypothetical protein
MPILDKGVTTNTVERGLVGCLFMPEDLIKQKINYIKNLNLIINGKLNGIPYVSTY